MVAALRSLALGFGLALSSMALLAAAMTAADIFTPFLRLPLATALDRFAVALSAGIFAGFLEEIFFRGILFKGLYQDGTPVRAYLLANLFYSALHFVRPGEPYFVDTVQPLAGFSHLAKTFAPFLEPLTLLPGIFGLFLLGAVLSYALIRSGKLYLSIGLHAGWVVGLKTIRLFGNYTREDLGWAFGSSEPKLVSGVATWVGILLVGVAVRYLTKNRSGQSSDRPGATTA